MKFNKIPSVCALTLVLATSFGLSGCSLSQPSVQEAENQAHAALVPEVKEPVIQQADTLTVGIRSSFAKAPMYIVDGNGRLSGLDVDMAAALADTLGLNVKYVLVGEKDTPESAKCDVIMDVTSSNNSDLTVVGNYSEVATAFFTKGTAHTADISEINGKKVGFQTASASIKALKESNLSVQEVPFENLNKAFEALSKGEIDYVMCDAYSGAYLANLYSGISMVGTLDVPQAYGVGVSSKNQPLQQAVQKAMDTLANNGLSQLIQNSWVGNIGVLSADSRIKGVEKKKTETSPENKEDNADSTNTENTNAVSALTGPNAEIANPGETAGANAGVA